MPTVDGQLLPRYARHLTDQRQLAPSTVSTYLSDAQTFLDWCRETGEMPHAMDRAMLFRYVAYLLMEAPDRRSKSKSRGLKRVTVKRMIAELRSFYGFLVQEGWFTSTPVPSGESMPMKVARPLPSFLTCAEADRLLEACDPRSALEVRDRAILELFYASGPRLAELHQLNTTDVDLIAYTVTVVGQRERNIPFGDEAWRWIREYLEEVRPALSKGDDPALWLNSRAGRLSRKTIGHIVRRYAAAAGLGTGVHPHTLRHSFASHLLDGGADIRAVQMLLGHEDAGSTEVYTPTTVEEHRRDYLEHHPMAKAGRARSATRAMG